MPYWKDAPSVKPEVFLSLSAPFRLLRADHYRLGRVSCYNIETSAGLADAAPEVGTSKHAAREGDKCRETEAAARERLTHTGTDSGTETKLE